MLSYIFLPFQKVTLLLIPYHFTIPSTSKNSIFIKIFFFLSLLFLFLGFPTVFFSQAPSTSSTNHKHRHKHKQTQTHADQKKSSSESIWNPTTIGANHDHDSTTIWNPADLKPTGANPFKKNHHRSHLSHDPTTTTTQPRPTTNDPLQPSSSIHDQRPPSAVDPRPTTCFIPARRSTTTTQPRQSTTHNHAKNHNHYWPTPSPTTQTPNPQPNHEPWPTTQTPDPT